MTRRSSVQICPPATNWHLCRPRILAANFYAAASMRNVILGVIEPWLHGANRAPGTIHAFPLVPCKPIAAIRGAFSTAGDACGGRNPETAGPSAGGRGPDQLEA